MIWTTQEMAELGTARKSIRKLSSLVEQLETLDETVYNTVVADGGEIIDRAHTTIDSLKEKIEALEKIKLKEYNEGCPQSS
jgi:uncharacterized coiled-coil protein SlyX